MALESLKCRGVAQPGSAPVLGTGGRKFESYRPDQFFFKSISQVFKLDIFKRILTLCKKLLKYLAKVII